MVCAEYAQKRKKVIAVALMGAAADTEQDRNNPIALSAAAEAIAQKCYGVDRGLY